MQKSFTLYTHHMKLDARDENNNTFAVIPSESTISAASDSGSIVAEIEHLLPGKVVAIDHDRDVIHVTTEE